MIWSTLKGFCRIYSGLMAAYLLAHFFGQALTGGIRVEGGPAHMMNHWDAFWLLAWLVAIVVTALTSKSEV